MRNSPNSKQIIQDSGRREILIGIFIFSPIAIVATAIAVVGELFLNFLAFCSGINMDKK